MNNNNFNVGDIVIYKDAPYMIVDKFNCLVEKHDRLYKVHEISTEVIQAYEIINLQSAELIQFVKPEELKFFEGEIILSNIKR